MYSRTSRSANKPSRNITLTKKCLKEHNLVAVPFDKGIGICIMKQETYHKKLVAILNLPQFEKVLKTRKKQKHPVLKEEEHVRSILMELRDERKIEETLFFKLKPTGSQPGRLYGLAKVHKKECPVRPVLSVFSISQNWCTDCGVAIHSTRVSNQHFDQRDFGHPEECTS